MLKRLYESEFVRVGLILGLGLLILFGEVIFLGYVQVPADILFWSPVLQEATPSGFHRPQNLLLSDHISQFYVWHHLASEAMQNSGRIPLWNPYILSGQPLLANSQPALFYPTNLLLFWLDPGSVANIRVFFNIFVAGIFTFLFCRQLKISCVGSTLAAIAFAFSGAIMVGPGHAYANSLVWLPFTMWSGEKLLNHIRTYFWGLITGIGIGLSILGGHPETVFHNLLAFVLYFSARLILLNKSRATRVRCSLSLILAIVLGLLLGAVQWIPFANFLSQSAITSRSRSWETDSIFYTSEWLPNLATLITLLFPNFFGNPAEYNYLWPFSNGQNYLEQSMYFGLIPIALAVGGVFSTKKRAAVIIVAALAIVFILIALRVPGFEAVNYLPVFNSANNTRLKWTFAFLGAILAGFGLDEFKKYILSNQTENKLVFRMTASVFMIAFTTFAVIAIYKCFALWVAKVPPDTFSHHLLFSIFSLRQTRTTVSIVVILVTIAAYWLFRQKPRLILAFEILLITLTFAELIVVGKGYNTTVSRDIIFPEVKLTRELQKDDEGPFRIMSADGAFWPNFGAVYGIFAIGGYDLPVFQKSLDIYLAQGGTGYKQIWSPDWPLVDWMNIKYLVSVQERDLEKFELVFAQDGYKLYRNKNVLPRAYMVYETEIIQDSQAALEKLISGTFDFEHKVILESDLPSPQTEMIKSPPDYERLDGVEFLEYDNDQVVLDIFTATPGMLVMSDLYAPGWQVQVDGREADLHRANYTFRAVFVPAGKHKVTFSYRPWDFQVGSALSVLGLVILAIALPISHKNSDALVQ